MNILVIEDEEQAGKRLIRQVQTILGDVFFHGPLETITEAKNWIKSNPSPDLVFLDIHLADGLSFEIFEDVELDAPIIFTTAYDQYAIRAFKLNSVDYLLKPIEKHQLEMAIAKFERSQGKSPAAELGEKWHGLLKSDYQHRFKQRFVSRIGEKISVVDTAEISFVFSENKGTYLRSAGGKNYLVDFTLEEVENLLDPDLFFRVNRKYIVRYEAIDQITALSNSRMKLRLKDWGDEDIVLSRDKTRAFKEWLDK